MNDIVIETQKISKRFSLGKKRSYSTLRDVLSEIPRRTQRKNKERNFWALRNVSFDLRKGDVLGIIGPNGAGKSTLLKILSRIIPPTKGQITINGRVATMLEVGTGFHPELTGRENIFLNGAILGMKRGEILNKFEKIVDFSGVKEFLDLPVKRYSSGMQVRLAFSIAAHLDPEILLIDEVLAVGDIAFQRKSLTKMYSIAKDEGRTIVIVSHNMSAIESLCNKTLLLERGKVKAYGDTDKVISKYINDFSPKPKLLKNGNIRAGNGKLRIKDFWIENEAGKRVNFAKVGEKCKFVFKYASPGKESLNDVDFGFAVGTIMEQPLFLNYTSYANKELAKCPPKGKFVFKFDKLPLAEGQYKIGFRATVKTEEADYVSTAFYFNVQGGNFYKTRIAVNQKHSPIYVNGEWSIEE